MNYRELKNLARRADRARREKRRRFVEKLIRELQKLDPFEGFSKGAVWFAKILIIPHLRYFKGHDIIAAETVFV